MVKKKNLRPAGHGIAYRERKAIGHGEFADVFPYDRKKRPRMVIRIPKHVAGMRLEIPTTEALNLYRRHQIAHLLFPGNNLRVRGLRFDDFGMVSDFVARTLFNKRFSVKIRRNGSYGKLMDKTGNEKILARVEEMEKAGIYPNLFESNIQLGLDGKVFFFEIARVDLPKLRRFAAKLPESKRNRLERLLRQWEFERSLSDVDLTLYLTDPAERRQIRREKAENRKKH